MSVYIVIDGDESISGHAVVVVFRPSLHGATPWRGFIYWQLELGSACADKTLTTLKHLGWQTPDFEILMANDIGSSGLGGRSHDLAIGLGLNNSHEVKGILKSLTF